MSVSLRSRNRSGAGAAWRHCRLLPLALLLGACGPPRAPSPEPSAIEPVVNVVDEDLRRTDGFSEELLYSLLEAELAGQRGNVDLALDNYLQAVRSTRDPNIIRRAVEIALYAERREDAGRVAEIWLEVAPGNTQARQIIALLALERGEFDKALGHLRGILESGDTLQNNLWLVVGVLNSTQDEETTVRLMDRLMEGFQEEPQVLFAYAGILIRMNLLERAERQLREVIRLEPENADAALTYLSTLRNQGRTEDALEWLAGHVDSYREDLSLRQYYARMLAGEDRFLEAKRQLQILAGEHEDDLDVKFSMALVALELDQLDEAGGYFRELLYQQPYGEEAAYYLGWIAELQEEFEVAVRWYRSVRDKESRFQARLRLAVLTAKQGEVEQARKDLRDMQAEYSDRRNPLFQAEAEILAGLSRYPEAMAVYDEALEESGYDAELLYARALVAEKMGELEAMESDLRRILERDPDNAQALNALGYALADRTDRYDEAYGLIRQALLLSPNNFYILDSMGWVLYRLGRLEEAVGYLRRALRIKKDSEVAAHLGEVLWKLGRRNQAQEVWNRALRADPKSRQLWQVIRQFSL